MSFLLACCLEIILGPSQQQNQAQDSQKPVPQGQGHGHGQQSNDTVNVVELQPISAPTPTIKQTFGPEWFPSILELDFGFYQSRFYLLNLT